MGSTNKTESVTRMVVESVLAAELEPGSRLPSEREMAERTGYSRVTVRRAYEVLRHRGIVERRPRIGTIIAKRPVANTAPIGTVAFLSTSNNIFAMTFVQALEEPVTRMGALLVLRLTELDPAREERAAIDLVAKGVRNLVFWPGGGAVMDAVFRRLRALGVNMVFVDRFLPGGYADFVGTDAGHVAETLTTAARDAGCLELLLVTHSDVAIDSDRLIEQAFERVTAHRGLTFQVLRVPWEDVSQRQEIRRCRGQFVGSSQAPRFVVAINDHVALNLYEILHDGSRLGSVGGSRLLEGTGITSYRVPVEDVAAATVECLKAQRRRGGNWRSRRLTLKGELKRDLPFSPPAPIQHEP